MRFCLSDEARERSPRTFNAGRCGGIGSMLRRAAAKLRQHASTSSREITMTRLASIAVLAGLVVIGLPRHGAAETAGPVDAATPGGRYSFHRMGESFIRLDAQTGQVAQCAAGAAGWSCSAMPDERTALESEIARLQRENAALKQSLLAKGIELPSGTKPELAERKDESPAGKSPDSSPALRLPSDAELDQAMAFMKKIWRRMIEMMADLQRDVQRKI
jgi:hypothetical protein